MAILSVALVGLVGGLSFVIRVSDTLEEQVVTETLAARSVEEYLNGDCVPEDSLVGSYQIEGLTVEEEYVVRVTLEGNEVFSLTTLAAANCPEGEHR